MKHLTIPEHEYFPVIRVLANWQTVSAFIYEGDATVNDMKVLLRTEVVNKNRAMIVERLTTRLISKMKEELRDEIRQDIKELSQKEERVGEEN